MWRFLTLCGFIQVACQGFLGREACVGVLVGGAVFLLSANAEVEDAGSILGLGRSPPPGREANASADSVSGLS